MSLDPQSVPFLRSCERCRQKKRKCGGERPSCAWCSSHNIPCRYRRTMRFKKQLEGQEESPLNTYAMPMAFPNSSSSGSNSAVPPQIQQSQVQPQPQPTPMLPSSQPPLPVDLTGSSPIFSADALARLLSVDMVPMSNPPPANLLQVANSFMTPLGGTQPLANPSWAGLSNIEAGLLANLGDVASAAQQQQQQNGGGGGGAGAGWMPVGLGDPLMDSGGGGRLASDFFSDELVPPIATDPAWDPVQAAALAGEFSANTAGAGGSRPSFPSAAVSAVSAGARMPAYENAGYGVLPQMRSPVAGAGLPGMLAGGRSASLASSASTQSSVRSTASAPRPQMQAPKPIRPRQQPLPQQQQPPPFPRASLTPQSSEWRRSRSTTPLLTDQADVVVPPILSKYLAAVPGSPSPVIIYKIMRETFRAPRMGMVSMNLEMLWYMLHKGVLPRIVFYGHISSTIRCSVADLDIKSMVPAHIDESCYQLALDEIPKVKGCAAVWGAVGICMVTRYEFQSSRYKQMARHADMALDIMHRIEYAGCRYPWAGVGPEERESFGFQYLLAIYWKCFLWKLMSLMLIEGDCGEFARRLDELPEYSSRTYDLYTTDRPYDVDLLAMIPEHSWEGSEADPKQRRIRFRGPSDADFMRMRPAGSPCFDRASTSGPYMQQLLVVFARFFVLAGQARRGQAGLGQLLKGLWVYKERMRMWRYSLPPELVLDTAMVDGYLEAIRPASSTSQREIDLRASRLKEVIMLLMTYHTFVVRANRYVMKTMLGEPVDVPAPDVATGAFGIRDLYDCPSPPAMVREGLGHMNMYFHGCRIQAIKSANALCSIVQAAYACRFNFYTLGSPIIFTIFELLIVYTSFLRNRDANIAWRAKARLSNVFNILRMLRHWAPALHIFVAGIKALSDPLLCLDEPRNFRQFKRDVMDPAMLDMSDSPVESAAVSDNDGGDQDQGQDQDEGEEDEVGVNGKGKGEECKEGEGAEMPPKRRRVVRLPRALETVKDARTNILHSIAPRGVKLSTDVRRDETLSYRAADPIPEFPNPFPSRHIISLIISDLGLSLAEFLAPAYPILLLKLIPAGSATATATTSSSSQGVGGLFGGRGGVGAGGGGSVAGTGARPPLGHGMRE
ncbi:hypothetical protein LPJ53_001733 [Coemansia erecta]|uniref:Zn(2)-C6 fungal-type domain-containing protein n=1 Tax=Coemansia erecta TaxID=147472 RepID=A0A9W7Y516_9FUNG|nr:hypothetical protein LPJ53_001733 [Coemansia erecta]